MFSVFPSVIFSYLKILCCYLWYVCNYTSCARKIWDVRSVLQWNLPITKHQVFRYTQAPFLTGTWSLNRVRGKCGMFRVFYS